ncbi:hypothetical protein BaRGS_00014959 [Batillaria attramentaria]|uniref:G-protein coupled receptors family 1 profile domain-containing protein n=1 Tax=Batillaria attramentaria TaxID=370345 RepID=A0ABD0L3K9_9CAEN
MKLVALLRCCFTKRPGADCRTMWASQTLNGTRRAASTADQTEINKTIADLQRRLSRESFYNRLPVVVYLFTLMVLGVVGNIIVLLVCRFRVPPSVMRVFIISMAVWDLLTSVVGLPLQIATIYHAYDTHSEWFCRGMFAAATVPTQASGWTVVLLAIARRRMVCLHHADYMTVNSAWSQVYGLSVVVAIVFLAFTPTYGVYEFTENNVTVSMCWFTHTYAGHPYKHVFNITLLISFVVGFTVMFLGYSQISERLRRRSLHAKTRLQSLPGNTEEMPIPLQQSLFRTTRLSDPMTSFTAGTSVLLEAPENGPSLAEPPPPKILKVSFSLLAERRQECVGPSSVDPTNRKRALGGSNKPDSVAYLEVESCLKRSTNADFTTDVDYSAKHVATSESNHSANPSKAAGLESSEHFNWTGRLQAAPRTARDTFRFASDGQSTADLNHSDGFSSSSRNTNCSDSSVDNVEDLGHPVDPVSSTDLDIVMQGEPLSGDGEAVGCSDIVVSDTVVELPDASAGDPSSVNVSSAVDERGRSSWLALALDRLSGMKRSRIDAVFRSLTKSASAPTVYSRPHGRLRLHRRITQVLHVLTFLYVLNWLPHLIIRFLTVDKPVNYCSNFTACGTFHNGLAIGLRSYYLNSGINAFVYSFFNPQFRKAWADLLTGRRSQF